MTRKTQRSCHPLKTPSLDRQKVLAFKHPEDQVAGDYLRAWVAYELLHDLTIDLVPQFTVGQGFT